MKKTKILDIDAYPLQWPEGWKVTPTSERVASRYQVSFNEARKGLIRELHLLGVKDVVLSSNVPLKANGTPYSSGPEPSSPGVAVYWITRKNEQRVIACDVWRKVRDNLRAVGLTVASLRAIQRAGASEILDRAFSGFKGLPEATPGNWARILGVDPPCTEDDVLAAYRRLAALRHPDKGGSTQAFVELTKAKDAALEALS